MTPLMPASPRLASGPLLVVVVPDWFIDGEYDSHGDAAVENAGSAAVVAVAVAVPKVFNEPSGTWEVDKGALTRGCCRFRVCC